MLIEREPTMRTSVSCKMLMAPPSGGKILVRLSRIRYLGFTAWLMCGCATERPPTPPVRGECARDADCGAHAHCDVSTAHAQCIKTPAAARAIPHRPLPRAAAPVHVDAPMPGADESLPDAQCAQGDGNACIVAWTTSCNRDDYTSCLRLAELRRDGHPPDVEEAERILTRVCDSLNKPASTQSNTPEPQSPTRSAQAAGCRGLGVLYEKAPQHDQVRAATLYRKACENGDPKGCVLLGNLYTEANDLGKALTFFSAACSGGAAMGCGLQAGVLADQNRWKEAYPLAEKACGVVIRFCALKGQMLCEGKGVAKDGIRAADLLTQACDQGSAEACIRLGSVLDEGKCVRRDRLRAAEFYSHACDAGSSLGCALLVGKYSSGDGVAADPPRARALAEKLCVEEGWPPSEKAVRGNVCRQAGVLLQLAEAGPVSQDRAAELNERACRFGVGGACFDAAKTRMSAHGGTRDVERARELLEAGCELKNSKACELRAVINNIQKSCETVAAPECAQFGFQRQR